METKLPVWEEADVVGRGSVEVTEDEGCGKGEVTKAEGSI